MQGLALLAVAALGAASSLVSTFNGVIGTRLGSLRATWIFMSVGAFLALGVVAMTERHVFDLAVIQSLPLHAAAPGLLNTVAVATVIRVVPVIGTMQTVATVFSGSVLVGITLDHVGAFNLPAVASSPFRVMGAILLVSAVTLLAIAHRRRTSPELPVSIPATLAAFTVGAMDNVAMAINADVASSTGPFAATVAFLLPGAIIIPLLQRRRDRFAITGVRPSDLLPGAYNVVAVAASTLLVPIVGLHLTNGTRFAAAILAGSVLDHFGVFGASRFRWTRARAAATTMLVTGVFVSTL